MSGGLQGFNAWLLQRITAALLVMASIGLLFLLLIPPARDFDSWQAWMNQPMAIVIVGVFAVALVAHAWVGVRDVIVDYIHPHGIRLLTLSLLGIYLLGNLIWLLWILL